MIVVAAKTQGQRRIKMEMRIDKGRRYQAARGVNLFGGSGVNSRREADDAAVLDRDVHAGPAVWQSGAADDEIKLHQMSPSPTASAYGALRPGQAGKSPW